MEQKDQCLFSSWKHISITSLWWAEASLYGQRLVAQLHLLRSTLSCLYGSGSHKTLVIYSVTPQRIKTMGSLGKTSIRWYKVTSRFWGGGHNSLHGIKWHRMGWVWGWVQASTIGLGKVRQEDCKFKDSLSNTVRSCLKRITKQERKKRVGGLDQQERTCLKRAWITLWAGSRTTDTK